MVSYIIQCKQNYFNEIYPADYNSKTKEGYKALIDIAKSFFRKDLYSDFALYFMEGQYFIQLWTAHLILEYGHPDVQLKNECINEIHRYAYGEMTDDISRIVSLQERYWLEQNTNFFKEDNII